MMTKMLTFIAVILVMDVALLVADAATIEAGALASITIDAPLYDTRTSGEGGCNPVGCSGDLTRVSSNAVFIWNTPDGLFFLTFFIPLRMLRA